MHHSRESGDQVEFVRNRFPRLEPLPNHKDPILREKLGNQRTEPLARDLFVDVTTGVLRKDQHRRIEGIKRVFVQTLFGFNVMIGQVIPQLISSELADAE